MVGRDVSLRPGAEQGRSISKKPTRSLSSWKSNELLRHFNSTRPRSAINPSHQWTVTGLSPLDRAAVSNVGQ